MEPEKINPKASQSQPINDVVPPPKTEPAVVEPPVVPAGPGSAAATAPAPVASKPADPVASPPKATKVERASKPIAAVSLAVVFFLVLTGIAYYAYTKSN